MDRIDRAGVETLSGLDWPVVTPIAKLVSITHNLVFLAIAIVLTITLRRLWPVVMTVLAMLIAGRFDAILKDIIDRPRPPLGDHNVHALIALPHDPSMPSGHAFTSFTCAIVLAGFAPRWRVPLLVYAGLVALTRPYLGVHYPSDVIVGACLGVALGLLLNAAFRTGCRMRAARRRGSVDPIASETSEAS